VRAEVDTLAGYSAHADPADLLNFVGRMVRKPNQVRLVQGDESAKATLAKLLQQQNPGVGGGSAVQPGSLKAVRRNWRCAALLTQRTTRAVE